MAEIRWRDELRQAWNATSLRIDMSNAVTTALSFLLTFGLLQRYGSPGGVKDQVIVVVSAALAALVLSPIVRFLGNLWRASLVIRDREIRKLEAQLGEVASHLGGGELVSVATFHRGNTGQVFITNVGDSDEFAAQVVGWAKGTGAVQLTRAAWYLKWAKSEGLRRELNRDETGRIDLAWIELRTSDSLPTEDRNAVTLHVNNCSAILGKSEMFAGQRYGETRSLKPIVYSFLLRFSAKNASRSQTVCVVARVVGRTEDDPKQRAIILKPALWLDRCDTLTQPTRQPPGTGDRPLSESDAGSREA